MQSYCSFQHHKAQSDRISKGDHKSGPDEASHRVDTSLSDGYRT